MQLRAEDVDHIRFPTAIRGYSEHAVDAFLDQVRNSLAAAESAVAQAGRSDAVGSSADSDPQQPLPAAAKLLQIAQTAADEQRADAQREAERLISDASAQAQQLLGDARTQAAATKAEAQDEAARIIESARATESAVQDHVNELRMAQADSRADLRGLAQHLIEIAETTEVHPAR
jgi:DivIVA domain-containing protein